MIIKYICSNRDEFSLYSASLAVSDGSYHLYKWIVNKDEEFERKAQEYDLTFQLRGTLDERKLILNQMTNDFERDIVNQEPGTFVFGEYSIKGYVIESSTHASRDMPSRSERKIKLYCPSGFWVKTSKYNFKTESVKTSNAKKYSYRYPYRYAASNSLKSVSNEGYSPSNFRMFIYGPASNPTIFVGENKYLVNITLADNERLEIDSRNETILKILEDGTKENAFHLREKGRNFFKKIPTGVSNVSWSGKISFDIEVDVERSEPRW